MDSMSEVERIGNAEREAAVADLRTHAAAGRISSKEYEERSLKVGQASTWADLGALFTDLPEPRPRPGTGALPAPPPPPYGSGAPTPPYGSAPPAPPYGDSSSTGTWGSGSSGSGSSGSYGRNSPTGFGRPPAPYGGTPGPSGPANWGGGPQRGLRRLGPLLPIIAIALVFAIPHAWFLVFLFPVLGLMYGGGRRGQGGYRNGRGKRRNRRGRDFY